MKIPFYEYSKVEKDIEVSDEDLALLTVMVGKQFLDHVEHNSFYNSGLQDPLYAIGSEKQMLQLCNKLGVNISSKEDRMAFFSGLFNKLTLRPLEQSCNEPY